MSKLATFLEADLDELVNEIKLEDAIALTSGAGLWHTHTIPSVNIPAIKV